MRRKIRQRRKLKTLFCGGGIAEGEQRARGGDAKGPRQFPAEALCLVAFALLAYMVSGYITTVMRLSMLK